MSTVALWNCPDMADSQEIADELQKMLMPFGGLSTFIMEGDRILLIPDLDEDGNGTSWQLIDAVKYLAKMAGATEVVVAEFSPQAEVIQYPVQGNVFQEINIYRKAFGYDLTINLPKLRKTKKLPLQCSITNLMSLLPATEKARFLQKNINRALLDLSMIVNPQLTIVDGSWQHEAGKSCFFLGQDMVAVDTVAAIISCLNPNHIEYLMLAAQYGFGVMEAGDININGDDIQKVVRELEVEDE